jgi:uncharacterized protein (DUF1501 family)
MKLPTGMPRLAFAPPGQAPRGDVLICVFQRGGMDGMNALVPMGDRDYYKLRPTIAVPEAKAGDAKAAIALDGFYGLHPALAPLKPLYDAGLLAPVHACGSPDPSHSHFDAMDAMERGTPGEHALGTGWLGRHLATQNTGNTSPLRAVGMGDMLQSALRGPVSALALQSIADFHLKGRPKEVAKIQAALSALYAAPAVTADVGLVRSAGQIEEVFGLLSKIKVADYAPANKAVYPDGSFGLGMAQIAQLIKADVGLEVACIDVGGWDTHAGEGGAEGQLAGLLAEFGGTLAALATDLGDRMKSVCVVTMSEFGRRAQENGSGGTDHGHANAMFLLGGGVRGGKVHGEWPGLSPDKLSGPGDLAMTTDYRDVLGEILATRLNNPAVGEIFPGYIPKPRGVVKAGG